MFSAWLVSLFALVVCAVFFFESFDIKTMPGADPAGPSFYPRIVIAGTALAALAVLLRLAAQTNFRFPLGRGDSRVAAPPSPDDGGETPTMGRVAFAMAISLAYPFAILKVGFVVATAAFTFILMRMFEQRLWISIVLPLALAVGLHFFFSDLLNARIVPGQWFDVMRALGL